MRIVTFVSLAFLVLWASLWAWTNLTEAGWIDACLDAGGRWNYEQRKCEGMRSTP